MAPLPPLQDCCRGSERKPSEDRISPQLGCWDSIQKTPGKNNLALTMRPPPAPLHPSTQEPLSLHVFTFPGNVFPLKSHRTNILLMLKLGANRDLEQILHLSSSPST